MEIEFRRSGSEPLAPLTVWYNTKCPVCDAGIHWQKNRLVRAARSGAILFRDINAEPAALSRYGASLDDIRRRLHAVTAGGELLIGADCAIAMWQRTPGMGWLARLGNAPLVHSLAVRAYDGFADWLYAWNRRKGRW